ncbi:hypothetical protein RAS2_21860 [Phycisphaerae bacterium RAS2]|nr:hypothetical protein RAS2_21860 [Phycisphaerae bacterium RAS2]
MGGSNSGWHGGNGRPQRKARVDECPVVLTVKELERRWPLGRVEKAGIPNYWRSTCRIVKTAVTTP